MNDRPPVEEQLLAFLAENAHFSDELTAATDLINEGVLDSLLVTDLVLFVESRFGVVLSAGNISPQHFRSVECLARLVRAKLEKVNKAA